MLSIKKIYWHTQPVHLTSPHSNSPDTHIKHFFPLYQWEYPAACHVRLAPTCSTGTTPLQPQFSISRRPVRTPLQTLSSARITLCLDHRLRSFWITLLDTLWISTWMIINIVQRMCLLQLLLPLRPLQHRRLLLLWISSSPLMSTLCPSDEFLTV